MQTRSCSNKHKNVEGLYSIKNLNSRSIQPVASPRHFKTFLKVLNDEIINTLNKRKREALELQNKIKISKNLYDYLNLTLNVKKKYYNDLVFFSNNNVVTRRYFPDKSYNYILMDTFEIKIGRMMPKKYFDNENLNPKLTAAKYYFFYRLMKKRTK